MPRATPKPAICAEALEDGRSCNQPKGHEGEHQFVEPKKPYTQADYDAELKPETPQEAATRIFGTDSLGARPVIAKLAKIMGEIGEITPMGRNQHFGYGFIKDTQINGAVRPRLAREGLMVIPDVVEESMVEVPTQRGRSYLTKLKVNFTVIDSVSGDSVSGHGFGYGDDSGDKGANKAFTAALKYWLMKLFEIGGEDDPEADTRADERAAQRAAGGGAPQTNVTVTDGGNISGIARGGMSEKITGAQQRQIGALYKDLELTPETFVLRIDQTLGDKLALPEDESEVQGALNGYVKNLSGEDAGKLITALVTEKDAKAGEEAAPGGDPYP